MPRSLILTSLFVLWHWTTHGEARLLTQAILSNEFRHHCTAQLGGYAYDLCPLAQTRVAIDAWSSDILITNLNGQSGGLDAPSYLVSAVASRAGALRSQVRRSVSSPARLVCGDNAWICLLDTIDPQLADANAELHETKDFQPILVVDADETSSEAPTLRLRLRLPWTIHSSRGIEIAFQCSDTENVKFIAKNGDMHTFVWATKHGCPKAYARQDPGYSITEEPTEDNGGEPVVDEGEKNEGDDDLLPNSGLGRTRRLIAFAVVFLVVSIVLSSVLFSSTKARQYTGERLRGVSHLLTPLLANVLLKLRPVGNTVKGLASKSVVGLGSRFRQGDSQLVRWAQEDMSISDSEDTMVNGSGAYGADDGWNAEGLEEYIPLNINPKHGRNRVARSYGATPDVETFAERQQGLLGGIGNFFKR